MEDNKQVEKAQKTRVNSPQSVIYVEVNDTNFLNAGCYALSSTEQFYDIAIIFAANINFNVQQRRAYLHFNNNVTAVLSDVDKYVRPLQAKGTKVLLSILGNHEGAGFCNFENAETARDFAMQLNDAVRQYGLDGIDFDDEYADYGNNGTGQPNAYSFLYLIRELRDLMPDKIISFYYYGPASSRLSYQDLRAGDYLDYSWNAIYGTWIVPNVPNMNKSQLSPAAVWVNNTNGLTAAALARRTLDEDYGVYLMYGLPNSNVTQYLTNVSQVLYQRDTALTTDNCLQGWPRNDGPMRDPPLTACNTETENTL